MSAPTSDTEMRSRQARSQRGFFAALGAGSRGSRVLDLGEGVQATVVPVREWLSIVNSTVYSNPAALREAHPALIRAYAEAGVKAWSVWVPPGDDETAEFLERRGHVREGNPPLMAADIDAIDLEPRIDLDLDPRPTWEAVALCNDRAHGVLPEWTLAATVELLDETAAHVHVAREGERVAAVLAAREEDGNCYFWLVATDPDFQRRGIGAELMRHALREARGRGCTTTTLESSDAGRSLYLGLGYRSLGHYGRWALLAS
jgi:ribosomal protein S18 acetylase RimI-like enzyme